MEYSISKAMKRYNHLMSEIEAVYHEISWKLGLSDSAFNILYTICDNGDSCLLHDICFFTGLSKQTINSAIRKMETQGIIYLESVGAKNKKVCLTEEGMRLADRTARKVIQAENDIFSSWEPKDVRKYITLTEEYLAALQDKAKDF